MFQWREHCDGGACSYEKGWLRQPIDSHKFRVAAGHETRRCRSRNARFAADEIRLGAFTIDPDLVATPMAAVAYPVSTGCVAAEFLPRLSMESTASCLPAATERRPWAQCMLPTRVVPLETVSLTAVQHGAKLTAD